MFCNISWLDTDPILWEQHYKKINKTNIIQSWVYAIYQAHTQGQRPRFGEIVIDKNPAGLMITLEASILNKALHAVVIDRAPLWYEGYGSLDHFKAFSNALRTEFPKRWGRKMRFIPEAQDGPETQRILCEAGFKHQTGSSYQTYMLDLARSEEQLRAGFKKRWRNALSKAEKNSLELQWDNGAEHLEWLLKAYTLDKAAKGYDGPSAASTRGLAHAFQVKGDLLLGRALKDGKAIAAILIFCHGRGATYQIGWNSQAGRDLGAHYILLWNALAQLKQRGVVTFDLGGVNDKDAKGVKTFKEGLGGTELRLLGIYA